MKPGDVSKHQHNMDGMKRGADVAVYFYSHGPTEYSGQWYVSTVGLPYHTIIVDGNSLYGREDTPDGYMGQRSVAGVWNIRRQCWIKELTRPWVISYDWSNYPPLRHDIRS